MMMITRICFLLPLMFLTSCNIIDLSSNMEFKTNPAQREQVISSSEQIFIEFDFTPDKISAESFLRITDYSGNVGGSLSWEKNRLVFTPENKMIYGRRYFFDFSGNVIRSSGSKANINILIPFWFETSTADIPSVRKIVPPGGSLISTADKPVILFTKEIDIISFKKGFNISPAVKFDTEWNSQKNEVIIIPEEKWENLTAYNFNITDEVKDINGIPLAEELCFTLYCDEDHEIPRILSTDSALRDYAAEFPSIDNDLNSIKFQDALKIVFSKPMDREKTENAFSITPYIPGRTLWTGSSALVFLPEKGWKQGTEYLLFISKGASSDVNINIRESYEEIFRPDIDELELIEIGGKSGDNFPLTSFSEASCISIEADGVSAPFSYLFTFNFSNPFYTDKIRLAAQKNFSVSCVYPPSGAAPWAVKYSWLSDRRLMINYRGFIPYNTADDIYYYYLLTIKGGESGIMNNEGSFLKNDIKQLLRTK